MEKERLRTEAAAQLAAEQVRLEGIEDEILATTGIIPEQLVDDLAHQHRRHEEAAGVLWRLSNPEGS